MARVTSFSRLPVGPTAPGSWPPWPASMAITSGRMPRRASRPASSYRVGGGTAGARQSMARAAAARRGAGGDGGCGRGGSAVGRGRAGAARRRSRRAGQRRTSAPATERRSAAAATSSASGAVVAAVDGRDLGQGGRRGSRGSACGAWRRRGCRWRGESAMRRGRPEPSPGHSSTSRSRWRRLHARLQGHDRIAQVEHDAQGVRAWAGRCAPT